MIDLHCHSTCSDGTCSPEELAEMGRGFSVFAITDHDNCDGGARFLEASRGQSGVRLAGIELSLESDEGYGEFHMLGLGIDTADEGMARFLEDIRRGRDDRNERMVAKLCELGMPLTMEEVVAVSGGEVIARPHVASAMMKRGYVGSIAEAFAKVIGPGCPAYCSRFHPRPEAAIAAIHAAGGVAVMAHPRSWTRDPSMLRSGLAKLKDAGLDGIEAVYQANTPDETIDHLRAAKELGLAVSAGSDFHGEHKPTITLGMNVEREDEFIAPLLARLEEVRKGLGR